MSGAGRPVVIARFRLGPWAPGWLLPIAVGAIGVLSTLLVLQGGLLVVGAVLSVAAAVRIRTAVPWVLGGLLVLGQLVRGPAQVGPELLLLLLALHLLAALTLLAAAVPARARVQLVALGPAARAFVLVQLPAQVLAIGVLTLAGRIPIVPAASTIGGALLLLIAAALVLPRLRKE